jgi:hypothetical protein
MEAKIIRGGTSSMFVSFFHTGLPITFLFLVQPGLSRRRVNLVNDPREPRNNWNSYDAKNLTLTWEWENITSNYNAAVDIALYGYWEDVVSF